MIITCNKCSTSFNLDDSLVKESGAKVRCSVCKDIFTAYPLPAESKPEPEDSSGLTFESDPDDDDIFEEPSDFEMEDNDFSLEEDSDLATESADFEMDEPDLDLEKTALEMDEPDFEMEDTVDPEEADLEMEDDLSFDDSELEIDEDGESPELELEETRLGFEDDGIDFGDVEEDDLDEIEFEPIEDDEQINLLSEDSEPSLEIDDETDFQVDFEPFDESTEDDASANEEDIKLKFDVEDNSENIVSDISNEKTDEMYLEIEPEADKEEAGLSLEKNEIEEEEVPPLITPEEDFSEYDEVLEQETEPEDDLLEEETIEIEDIQEKPEIPVERQQTVMDTTPRSGRRRKKPLIGAPVLVLLLIFFLVIGAYIASIMTGYNIPYISNIKIPFIEQYFKKNVPEASEATPVPNQKSVNGRFVTNASTGTLFVITGRVENPSNIAYSHIEIRGTLITKGKKEAKIKNAFCGNIITEEMLKTGNISDINKLLVVKAGNHNSNVNVKSGASVPFMVVFSDLPEKLQNFTVKVIKFEKAVN
jgi:predicted Zn finger-like uncharacterized protein